MEEIDDKVTHVTMVENSKLNEDGTRNRFHIEKDEVGVKCILFKIRENYPFLMNNDIGKDFVFFPANSG